jgi:hypothetical protein
MDECEAMRQAVTADGTTVAGSNGQPRMHPAIGELRSHRLTLGCLLSQLALPDEDGEALPTPLQARGRAAVSKRWAGHAKRARDGTAEVRCAAGRFQPQRTAPGAAALRIPHGFAAVDCSRLRRMAPCPRRLA